MMLSVAHYGEVCPYRAHVGVRLPLWALSRDYRVCKECGENVVWRSESISPMGVTGSCGAIL